jgi:hypothetical protein
MILSTAPLNIYGISLEPAGAFTSLYTLEWPYHKEENSPDQIIPSFRLLESTYLWRPTFMKPVKPSTGIIQGRQRQLRRIMDLGRNFANSDSRMRIVGTTMVSNLSLSRQSLASGSMQTIGVLPFAGGGMDECRLEDALEFISPCRAASR